MEHLSRKISHWMILFAFIANSLPVSAAQANFADVPAGSAFLEAISYLKTKGIVQGYPDGTFKPDRIVNRAEFTKILMETTASEMKGQNCFSDVKTEWFAPYICTAKIADIVGGYPDGTFKPANPITFAEAAKIVTHAFGIDIAKGENSVPWYEEFVLALEGRSAIPLEVQKLDQEITRGQMAEVIYRLHAHRTDKFSQTYAYLSGTEDSEGDRVLVTLPLPFTRYRYHTDPTLKVDVTGKNHMLILPIETNINDNDNRFVRLFINGEAKGDFKGIAFADFVGNESKPVYVTSDGERQTVTGLPKFKQISREAIEKTIKKMQSTAYIDDLRTTWSKYASEEAVEKEIERVRVNLPQHIELTKVRLEEQFNQPAKELTEFLTEDDSIRLILRNSISNEYLVVVSPSFASLQVMLFKDGGLAANHETPLYFHIAENEKKTKFLYRGQEVSDFSDSEFMVVNDGMEGKKYAWVTQPQYNAKDEAMYMAFTNMPEAKEGVSEIKCKAVIGSSEKDVACNDQLYITLINHPFFRLPVTSPDGRTTVYAELVKPGTYENINFENGIESAPTSRLVVNGVPQKSHPYIDKPFFTSKGLAVLSYVEKPNSQIGQYVEWNEKKSAEYEAIGTGLVETLGFRGVSPLYAAISSLMRGDLGVEEIDPEIVISPDQNSIAFAGYKSNEGWTVLRDLNVIGTYKLVDQLTFSPDSKHLAFAAVTESFEPLLNQSFWLGEESSQSAGAISSVIVDGFEIAKHEKILWLQYAPNGVLTYIGRDQKQYVLYIDGKPAGAPFDRVLMPPRFKDGLVEVGGARGEKIVLMEQPLDISEFVKKKRSNASDPAREETISQESIQLTETIKNNIPSSLKPFSIGSQNSSTFYTDGKNVYALSLMEESTKEKIYNLYRLEGEAPGNFKILNEYYAIGNKAYSHTGRMRTAFSTGKTIYGGPNIKVISNRAGTFMAIGRHAKDGIQAFYLSQPISADVESFQPLNEYFAKDKFSIFYNGKSFAGPDPATFIASNDTCGADSKNTYCHDRRQSVFKLPPMDGSSLQYIRDGLAYDKTKAVCLDYEFELDTNHFRSMPYGYGSELLLDKKRVYEFIYMCPPKLIEDMEPNTLEEVMVDGKPSKVWLKDARHVFYALKKFPDADPKTFHVLLDHEFSLDAKHVFWRNENIPDADPRTFELITDRYAKDAQNVYLWNKIIPNADPNTFVPPSN